MPRRGSIIVLSVVAGTLLAPGLVPVRACALQLHHGAKRDARHQVEDLEEQWRMAQLTGDAGAMDRLLSNDYVGISMTGQVNTKAQQLDRLRSRTLTLTRIDLSDVKVKLLGQVAIVTSRADVAGNNDGIPMNGVYRYTRVYQRMPNGTWLITSFEATRIPNGQGQNRPPVPAANGN